MKKIICLLCIFSLVSCSSNNIESQETITPTPTMEPTVEPSTKPLDEIDETADFSSEPIDDIDIASLGDYENFGELLKTQEIYSLNEYYTNFSCENIIVSYIGSDYKEKNLIGKVYNSQEDKFIFTATELAGYMMHYFNFEYLEDNIYKLTGLSNDEVWTGPEGSPIDTEQEVKDGYFILQENGMYLFIDYTLEEILNLKVLPESRFCKFHK